ncbi:RNA-binding protein [Cupriavidus sp. WKF15]|uniref:RNA-binding protein n=1 Tax=Cupriavidus sp. WKF15 TaxID=3032282 RepID=UPI0023E28CC6|nr:RNA-binding protein [Cupriavidus sp. WKF15]WER47066.1 RNA-binding protein [Cupriavidus sp. WKF15]
MAVLFLGNIDAATTDEEVRDFLIKYGLPAYDEIEHVQGDGTHPGVTLVFNELDPEALRKLQPRIHGMFWKGHKISAMVMAERYR